MTFPVGTFATSIIFNIILPTFDIGSDGILFASTMSFKGQSLAMAGWRTCYHEANSNSDIYSHVNSCNVCATDGDHFGIGGIFCGAYSFSLDIMQSYMSNKHVQDQKQFGELRPVQIRLLSKVMSVNQMIFVAS